MINIYDYFKPVFSATGGLTLSQVCELTNLESTTVQNWIKRGWVAAPNGKRYAQRQIIRIIIINMLRNALKLEVIVKLMNYINGDVESESDDIISDIELYNTFCMIIYKIKENGTLDTESWRKIINTNVNEYKLTNEEKAKLENTLFIMLNAYISGEIKRKADEELQKLF